MLCRPFCLCRAGVAWSVRSGGLLAASLSRSALLGLLRPFALRCRAVVVGAPLLALRSFYSVLPRASARRQKTKRRRRTTTPDQGLAAARPLSAALAASAVVPAIVRGTAPACGLPLLAPVRRVLRPRSVYTLYHERLFDSCILNTIRYIRGLTCIH